MSNNQKIISNNQSIKSIYLFHNISYAQIMNLHIHQHKNLCTHSHSHTHTLTNAHLNKFTHSHTCTKAHIYTNINLYTHSHKHTHTHTSIPSHATRPHNITHSEWMIEWVGGLHVAANGFHVIDAQRILINQIHLPRHHTELS